MKPLRGLVLVLLLAGVGWLGWAVYEQLQTVEQAPKKKIKASKPVPVDTAPIGTGAIALERNFSGTLEADKSFVAAPKVGGLIKRLMVNLGDSVSKGQVVAKLDDAEYVQALAKAQADLAVAKANQSEAVSLLKIAQRELKRFEALRESGISSASQRDVALADRTAREAQLLVTNAQLLRAEAALETARIQLGYTDVKAGWHDEDQSRLVAQRFVDEGETVSANAELLKIIQLDPINAVLFATEKDYAGLHVGQPVNLSTDAFPNKQFRGQIARIAPEFNAGTRQARIEIQVANAEQRLKPGMFVRAKVVLRSVTEATVIPLRALTKRKNQTGVFVIDEGADTARWQLVTPGIQQDDLIQIESELSGLAVVVLGQQLLKDGAKILVNQK